MDAWRKATGIANGSIPPEETEVAEGTTDKTALSIQEGIRQYLEAVSATKGDGTYRSYRTCLRWAEQRITKHLVYRLDRNDLLGLFASGRKEALNQKTINKRVTVILNMVRHHDHDIKLKKGDWPKTTDKPIEVYTEEEMNGFFSKCTEEERLLFEVFLNTGFRDKEVAHLIWSDVDYRLSKIKVTAKPQYAFKPKSYEIRSVDVPRSLLDKLKKRQKNSTSLIVFPTAQHPTRKTYGGGFDKNLLDNCKEIAFRAGLNCGHCTGTYTLKRSKTRKETLPYSCKTHPRCERWYLHKWRHTYASHMIGVLGLKGSAASSIGVSQTSSIHFTEDGSRNPSRMPRTCPLTLSGRAESATSFAMQIQRIFGRGNIEFRNAKSSGFVWASSFASQSPAFRVCADSLKSLVPREIGKRPRVWSDGKNVNAVGGVFADLQ